MLYAAFGDVDLVELWLAGVEEPHDGVLVGLQLGTGIFHVVLVDLCQLWGSVDADILQTGYHIDTVGHVDSARAETTGEEIVGVDAEEGDSLEVADGKYTCVLQQHHAFGA